MIHQHCNLVVQLLFSDYDVLNQSSVSHYVCLCVLPGAEFRWCTTQAHNWYLQGGRARVVGGSTERPRRQERGAQGRAEAPAEMQRGARSSGHGTLLLITLLILADGRQLLHQATVALPIHLKEREEELGY